MACKAWARQAIVKVVDEEWVSEKHNKDIGYQAVEPLELLNLFHDAGGDLDDLECWGLYSLVCPWTDHILAGTRFLKLKRIFLGSRREAISPLIFTHKFGEQQIAIKVLTKRVTPNRFGPAGPIDTSVRQRTNSSIGTGPSGFLQHALQIYTRASSSGKRRDTKKHEESS